MEMGNRQIGYNRPNVHAAGDWLEVRQLTLIMKYVVEL